MASFAERGAEEPLSPAALRAVLAAELSRCDARAPLARAPSSASRATVRVFCSSTFSDFVRERFALNTVVVPELTRRCRARGLDFVLVDLLWGVPEDTHPGETCRLCMDEVDKCVAANGAPYFLYLAGERFGWVPRAADLGAHAEGLRAPPVRWIDGVSVTTMELLHGAARGGGNPNAVVCVRAPAYAAVMAARAGARAAAFVDEPERQREVVAHVRRVYDPAGAFPGSLIEYDPLAGGAPAGAGAAAEGAAAEGDCSDFTARVTEALWAKVCAQYPPLPAHAAAGSLRAQSAQHEAAVAMAVATAAPRPAMLDRITRAVRAAAAGPSGGVVLLVGSSGAGKSTLLAQAAAALRRAAGGDAAVVAHVTGAADRSEEAGALAARLVVGVRLALAPPGAGGDSVDRDGGDVPGDAAQACALAAAVLRGAAWRSAAPPAPLVLAVDAVNQLRGASAGARLAWLPPPGALPRGLVVLVSATPGDEAAALASRPDAARVDAGPLDADEARALLAHVLRHRYAKQLSREHADALLAKAPGASSPLWLRLALARLHVLGRGGSAAVGGTLAALIADVPPRVEGASGLLALVLATAEERGGADLVRAALLAACVSPSGLRESEALVAIPWLARALAGRPPAPPAPAPAPAAASAAAPVPAAAPAAVPAAAAAPEPAAAPAAVPAAAPSAVATPSSAPPPSALGRAEPAVALPPRTWAELRAAVDVLLRATAPGAESLVAPAHALVAEAVEARYGSAALGAARLALAGYYESGHGSVEGARRATEAPALYEAAREPAALARALCCAEVIEHSASGDSAADRVVSWARAADASGSGGYDDAARALAAWAAGLDAADGASRRTLSRVASLLGWDRLHQLAPALDVYSRVLAAEERALGPDHLDVATTLHHMAVARSFLRGHSATVAHAHGYLRGHASEVLGLFERALSIKRRALGDDHATVADTLNFMAQEHAALGHLDQALELGERALAVQRVALGDEHASVAFTLYTLVQVNLGLGRTSAALELGERALAIALKSLGEEHGKVSGFLDLLARVNLQAGRLGAALELSERALVIMRKALGEEHALVSVVLDTAAQAHLGLDRAGEAAELCERALSLKRRALGEEHLSVASTLDTLAAARRALGEHAAALAAREGALRVRERAHGESSEQAADALLSVADELVLLGRHADALAAFERELSVRRRLAGAAAAAPDAHHRAACAACRAAPIVGVRHVCTVCRGVDLCAACHAAGATVAAHAAAHQTLAVGRAAAPPDAQTGPA